MGQVIIGMDPHNRSATIEVINDREKVLVQGRFGTDSAGYVVSELMRPEPAPAVLAWLQRSSADGLHTTAVTIAEIRHGIAHMPEGRRRQSLHQAADEIFAAFPRQVLPFDLASASAYADIVASREKQGNPISGFDAQIAAICRSQAASLATRNARDFVDTGISLLDPWQPAN